MQQILPDISKVISGSRSESNTDYCVHTSNFGSGPGWFSFIFKG